MKNQYVCHSGVKGMKWGIRKKNPNYDTNQRKRDSEIYGKSSVGRINRSMNRGSPVSTARAKEKTRHDNTMERSRTAKKVGTTTGAAVGAVAGWNAPRLARMGASLVAGGALMAQIGANNKTIKDIAGKVGKGAVGVGRVSGHMQNTPIVKSSLALLGASSVSSIMGRKAQRGYIKAKGYNPNRK